MLNVLSEQITIKAENGQETPLSFAYAWAQSEGYKKIESSLVKIEETKDEKLEIVVETEYAASKLSPFAVVAMC
jgi:hypothetical protein